MFSAQSGSFEVEGSKNNFYIPGASDRSFQVFFSRRGGLEKLV